MISLKLMREFEAGRPVAHLLGDTYQTPTGEPYVSLSGEGGEDAARKAFAVYAENRKGVLYWRTLPEITENGNFYMRLFVAKD